MWHPINGGALPTFHLPGSDELIAVKASDAPDGQNLYNWGQEEYDLSFDESVDLGFALVTADEKGDHRTIVLDAMRYSDVNNVRWGVGIRFTLHAWSTNDTVKGSLPLVAAQVSLNLAYSRASMDVIGLQSSQLAKDLPSFSGMGVEHYGDLMNALDTCRNDVLDAPDDQLHPQPVAVFSESSHETKQPGRWWPHLHRSQPAA